MSIFYFYLLLLANCLLIDEYLNDMVNACNAITDPLFAIIYLPPESDPNCNPNLLSSESTTHLNCPF